MTLTKDEREELVRLSIPLIRWLNETCHPHVRLIVTCETVECVEDVCLHRDRTHLKD